MAPRDGLETIFPGVEYKTMPGALLVEAAQTGGVAMRLEA